MNRPNPKPAPIAVVWVATEPAPRGWTAWLKCLLSGYAAGLGHPGAGITLLVADDAALRDLNAAHRGHRRPTDILSFGYGEAQPSRRKAPPGAAPRRPAPPCPAPPAPVGSRRSRHGTLLGELAVSWERVRVQARANGWEPRTEMARLLAHGCVHLLGHDHATRAADAAMLRIEERLLDAAGFAGLYPAARPPGRRRRPSSNPG